MRPGGLCNKCFGGAAQPVEAGRLEMRRVDALSPHPANHGIYRDGPSPEFIANIRANGILSPIIITPDDQIVAGHRRHAAAREAGLEEVPVLVREFADELAVLEALVATNAQREKTNDQLGREAQMVREIERRKSFARSEENLNQGDRPGHVNAPTGGRWRERASELMGIGSETVRCSVAVADRLDELERVGDAEGARELRATLNQSVRRAYDSIRVRPESNGHDDRGPFGDARDEPEAETPNGPTLTGTEENEPTLFDEEAAEVPPHERDQEEEGEEAPKKPKKRKPRSEYDKGTQLIEEAQEALPTKCPQGCPLEYEEEQEPFDLIEDLKELAAHLRKGHQMMKALAVEPGGEALYREMNHKKGDGPDGIAVHCIALENVIKMIEGAMPACRYCPYCARKGEPDNKKDCKFCQGRLFFTVNQWKALDRETDGEELKALALAQAAKK